MMKSRLKSCLLVFAAAGIVSGCAGFGGNQGSAGSTATTTPLLATDNLLGALNGGLINRFDGVSLRPRQALEPLRAEYRALEYTAPGQPVAWNVAQSGLSGAVTASQPYRVGSQDCRQYTQVVNARSGPTERRGTACRNDDGSWSLLN